MVDDDDVSRPDDGLQPVRADRVPFARPAPRVLSYASRSRPGLDLRALAEDYRRAAPPSGVQAAFLVLLTVVVLGPLAQLISLAFGESSLAGTSLRADTPWQVYAFGLLGMVCSALLGIVVLLEMRVGRAWARSVGVVIAAFALLMTVVGIGERVAGLQSVDAAAPFDTFVLIQMGQAALLLVALVLLFHRSSRSYYR